jgi:hypothetical protein
MSPRLFHRPPMFFVVGLILISSASSVFAAPRQAPGGSRAEWIAGFQGGWLDAVGDEADWTDSPTFGVEIGKPLGFQSVRLLRYRFIAVNRSLDFPVGRHRSQLHDLSLLYRLHLMPDHWAGPVLQLGPSVVLAQNSFTPRLPDDHPYTLYGGIVLGTGLYAHMSTTMCLKADVLFERFDTGRFLSHDAAWAREFALGMDFALGQGDK